MEVLKRSRSKIYSSILKNGYSNFQLDILEYCNKEDLLKREQYFIDLLKPGYNILNSASSSLGLKHTAETKKKMSELALGRTFSKETLAKISKALTGKRGKPVELIDKNTGNVLEYVSINQAAKAFNVRSEKVRRCILNKTLLFDQYIVRIKD